MLLRAFKKERQLEVWVGDKTGPMKMFRTYPVLAASGKLGPKLREGDLQVPEGLYRIDRFNPKSKFHLSLGIDYPNARDRERKEPKPGGDIFIHGEAVSIGCLAIGNEAIEEVYLLALDTKKKPIPVHIFPTRMDDAGWTWLTSTFRSKEHADLIRFWSEIRPAYLRFEKSRQF